MSMRAFVRLRSTKLLRDALLVLAGIAVGIALMRLPVAEAEVRRRPGPTHFPSGGQASIPVLREIVGILTRVDARVANIEASVDEIRILSKRQHVRGLPEGKNRLGGSTP